MDPISEPFGPFDQVCAVHDSAMKTGRFRCCSCKKLKWKRTLDQRYCGARECQKARKNRWRREKYATDADYRANQRDSTKAWLGGRGGSASYFRAYRAGQRQGPECTSGTPGSAGTEAVCVDCPRGTDDANSDARSGHPAVKSGVYMMNLVSPSSHANSDAFLATISLIPFGCTAFANIDPMVDQGADR